MTTQRIIPGDCIEGLRTLPDASVHCCVTSPPYWGLRDYGHDGQIGLEPTPEAYVARMVEVFGEVRRVLRDDGTLWLNLGDSYAAARGGTSMPAETLAGGVSGRGDTVAKRVRESGYTPHRDPAAHGLKHKDLVGIPWRVAFALQADGWWLRQDIIWHKPNPMPESVRDRCTKAHEYVFLLTKGQHARRAIKFANLQPETVHFGRNLGAQNSYSGTAGLCVSLATALFDLAQSEHNFSLPPFYAEEWKQSPQGADSNFVACLPAKHRAAAHASRFLSGHASTKEFLSQIDRLWRDLAKTDHLLVGSRLAECSLPPAVSVDGDGTIAINDAGKVSKIDFVHSEIVVTVPTECKYFYDAEAVSEAAAYAGVEKNDFSASAIGLGVKPSGNAIPGTAYRVKPTRNRRSVWTITTKPYSGAHFAVMPADLVEPCVRAGTSEEGCCPTCGAPWVRVVEKTGKVLSTGGSENNRRNGRTDFGGSDMNCGTFTQHEWKTTGWQPSCECDAHQPVPCTVLDPFAGSGTTLAVAAELGRNAIGCELNPEYIGLAERRIKESRAGVALFEGVTA